MPCFLNPCQSFARFCGGLLLFSGGTARAFPVGCNPLEKRENARPNLSSGFDHVCQQGRRFPFSVFLEQLKERHRLAAFQLEIASQRMARD